MTKMILATRVLVLAISLFAQVAHAAKVVGSPKAKVGGTFYQAMASEPTTLHPLTSTDLYSSTVQGYVMDGLLGLDIETHEWQPALAERWKVSKDGLTFTFWLRKDAKFHDGKPVTAEDVKFTFDAIKDPKYKAAHMRPYYENILSATIVDPYTIKFKAKRKLFNNLMVLASGMAILPKHIYKDPAKKLNKTLMGSGPYTLHKYNKGKSIILKRNPNWWGNKVDIYKYEHNVEKVFFRFVKEENVRIEMLKKGRIDFMGLNPEQYVKKTKGAPWGTKALKKKVENSAPKGYGFVGWNLKKKMFQDRDVRVALAHLMNRELMNEKFRYGMSLLATGPWYQQNPYASKKVKPFKFDPKKAQRLLRKAGWQDTDKDGVLDRAIDGRRVPFRFTLIFSNRDHEKYFTLYKEGLKKAGIDMELKVVEWNSFVKSLDDKKFDAAALGWSGGSVDLDPKQVWHSSSARKGGSNFTSYSNPQVDKLIDKARQEMNKKKRVRLLSKVYEMIAADAPYAFMFNDKFVLYAHTSKMKMQKPTYKYGIGDTYWWIEK